MKTKSIKLLLTVLVSSLSFGSILSAGTVSQGSGSSGKDDTSVPTMTYSYDIGGQAPISSGSGGLASTEYFYSKWVHAAGVKVSLLDQSNYNATPISTYYYMAYKPGNNVQFNEFSVLFNIGNKIPNSVPKASGKALDNGVRNTFSVCGKIVNGKYTTDCENLGYFDTSTEVTWSNAVLGKTLYDNATWNYASKILVNDSQGTPEFVSATKIHNWIYNTNNSVEHEGFYEVLKDLKICNTSVFKPYLNGACTSTSTLHDKIVEMSENGNELLDKYILVFEPIYKYAVGVYTHTNAYGAKVQSYPYTAFFTMKGIANQLANNTFPGKYGKQYGLGFDLGTFANNMIAVESHGEFIKNKLSNYPITTTTSTTMNTDNWRRFGDAHNGWGYGIYGLSQVISDKKCEKLPNPTDERYGYGKDKTIVSKEKWEAQCGCTTKSDGKGGLKYYIDQEEVTKERYDEVCTCIDGEANGTGIYKDNLGKITTKEGYEAACKKPEEKGLECTPKTVVNMPNTCSVSSSGYAYDDTMCSIVNSKIKDNYKITQTKSDLNTTLSGQDICTIYCRESFKFQFMKSVDFSVAGRFFQYDVDSKYSYGEKPTTVVLSTRECTSIIDYDLWKKEYDEANNKVISAWNSYNAGRSSSNERTLSDALKNRDIIIYKLEDCNFMQSNKDSNNEMNNEAIYKSNIDGVVLRNYDLLLDYEPNSIITVNYDENSVYGGNYQIGDNTGSNLLAHQTHSVFESIAYSKDDFKTTCTTCNSDISTDKNSSKEDISALVCSYSSGSYSCSTNNITVPSNKIASITYENETIYYQGTLFSTRMRSGEVKMTKEVCDNQHLQAGYRAIYDKNIYPLTNNTATSLRGISLNYSNIGANSRTDIAKTNGSYSCSYQVYNLLNLYECDNTPDHINQCKCDPKKEVCEGYDITDTITVATKELGYYFRVVDLNNLFPNNRSYATNWTTEAAKQIVEEIESLGSNIIGKVEPMYKVELTSNNIRKIKNYNLTNNYLDTDLICVGDRCYSSFLRNNTTGTQNKEFGSVSGKYDWGTITVNSNVSSNHYYGN